MAESDLVPLSLPRFAEATVYATEFSNAELDEVLGGLGLSRTELDAARAYWTREIARTLGAGDPSLVLQFAAAYGRVEREVRLRRPAPRDVRSSLAEDRSREPALVRRRMRPLPVDSDDAPSRPAAPREELLPSYMREAPSGGLVVAPPKPAAPPAPVDPDATVIGAIAIPVSLPFRGRITEAEAKASLGVAPPRTPDSAGLTEELPGPEALAEMIAAAQRFKKANASEAGLPMTLEEYARLRATLALRGENNEATLREFNLTAAEKERVQKSFVELFQGDPAARERFHGFLQVQSKRLRDGGGG